MRKILLRTALRCSGLRNEWNNADGINYRYVLKRTKAVTIDKKRGQIQWMIKQFIFLI